MKANEIKPDYEPKTGDIFACWGGDWLSRGISLETSSLMGPREVRWAPSHVAIACPRWYPHDHLGCFWWESTSLIDRPCLEAGRSVAGCQVHHIRDRLIDYVRSGGRVSVYRLTEFDCLTEEEQRHLRALLGQCVGDRHDEDQQPVKYDTAGALCSGTRIVRRFTLWRNQLDSLFCSELLAAVLQRLGRLCRQNPSSFTPAQLMRRLLTEGTYRLHTTFDGPSDWRLR